MTVQPAYTRTMPDRVTPYITRDQYRCAPTSIDTQALIRGGSQADQDAALDRLIREASGWCDKAADQPLPAQRVTESMQARATRDGTLKLITRQCPVVAVYGVSFGPDLAGMSALNDLSNVWIDDRVVEVPMQAALSSGYVGPLQFNTARPGSMVKVLLDYAAGFPVTTLAADVTTATATQLTVADATGIIPGTMLHLTQGGSPSGTGSNQKALTQASVTVQSVLGTTVTLTGQVGATFLAGAGCSGMPAEVEQACIYVVTALLKQPGSQAMVMHGGNAGTLDKGNGTPWAEELEAAEATLALYRPLA